MTHRDLQFHFPLIAFHAFMGIPFRPDSLATQSSPGFHQKRKLFAVWFEELDKQHKNTFTEGTLICRS
jgi:hypothetical protein